MIRLGFAHIRPLLASLAYQDKSSLYDIWKATQVLLKSREIGRGKNKKININVHEQHIIRDAKMGQLINQTISWLDIINKMETSNAYTISST